jgi:hypothetical protein
MERRGEEEVNAAGQITPELLDHPEPTGHCSTPAPLLGYGLMASLQYIEMPLR